MEEPLWLTRAIVEALHADQIREHGGRSGIRDKAPLESALARPRQRWVYDPDADLAALAAEYGYGLARNHPFVDGNKRTAFVATNVLLILNGFEIDAPEPAVVDVMLQTAAGRMDQRGFASWIRTVLSPYDPGSSGQLPFNV
jgi:death on curing protein